MLFTIGTITRCAGTNHWQVSVTVNGVTRILQTDLAELQEASPEGLDESRAAVVSRIRSALLEANATNFAQSRTALEGKGFKV